MWKDTSITWKEYDLEDRKTIQASKTVMGAVQILTMEKKLIFTENSKGSRSVATFTDKDGVEWDVSWKVFDSLGIYAKKIQEVIQSPDEIWTTKKGSKMERKYIKFYQGNALVLVCDFNAEIRFRIRSINSFKGDVINDHRKGVLMYG